MPAIDPAHILGVLAVILASAKLFGYAAQRLRQPAVLGELIAGVVVGVSCLNLVNPDDVVIHLLSEMGVVILLFEIGLETDLKRLLKVGPEAAVVACAGVALPFGLGYGFCKFSGLGDQVSVVVGAALTATSVGITARVLTELGRLQDPEGQIVLGAAIIDDLIGLVILAVVQGFVQGGDMTAWRVAAMGVAAFGFLAAVVIVGRFVIPPLFRSVSRIDVPGTLTMLAVILMLGLAWAAAQAGSAPIIGAFAAGVLLAGTPRAAEIESGVASLGHFFVPIFFVAVGAAVDVREFNPFDAAKHTTLLQGFALIGLAVAGKFVAGYSIPWFKGRKAVVGVGMIPRGEVGLIFAQRGYAVLGPALYSAIALMVLITTFIAPPLLRLLLPAKPGPPSPEAEGIEELVTEA